MTERSQNATDENVLDLETLTRGTGWGREAFRDAGEATFCDREATDDR